MKKLVIAGLLIAVILIGCASTSANKNTSKPDFNRPNSVVFDAWNYGTRYEDYVKVYSSMPQERISFNVFGYDAVNKKWDIIGTAALKGMTDLDTIDSPLVGDIDKYRWFAIQSLDGLSFSINVVISSNDIRITVYE